MKARVLIVDDDPGMRDTLEAVLKADGYSVHAAENGGQAMEILSGNKFDVVLLDLQLPDGQGTDLLPKIKASDPEVLIIMMTAFGTIRTAVEALKRGAFEFITKPFELDEMMRMIQNALKVRQLARENAGADRMVNESIVLHGVVGKSPRMAQVFDVLKKVVNYDVTILITGESGTGKEIIAQAIHDNSPRRDKPFVKLHSAALPETLLESELFGYEKGAFTGAVSTKPGRFELAEGGTIFLDEICEISHAMQTKLLRVLHEKEYDRVGGTRTMKADVRILCATNKNVKAEVDAGRFREDLYYRLNVIHIQVPPLRERLEDLPEFVQFILDELNHSFGKNIGSVSQEAMDCLLKYGWPGNVRELRNVLEKAVLLEDGKIITLEHLPEELRALHNVPFSGTQKKKLEMFERDQISQVLEETNWNQSKAAIMLGMHRNTLREKIRRLNISVPEGKDESV
jgi:DNA-binding NtrC family response regulator